MASTTRFDAASYLKTNRQIAAYMNEVLQSDDPALFAEALGTVARARGMGEVAHQTKVSRESLYRSLSAKGNPEIKTVSRVLNSLGLRLTVMPVRTAAKASKTTAAKTIKSKKQTRMGSVTKQKAKARAQA